jgi:hypothetical protein
MPSRDRSPGAAARIAASLALLVLMLAVWIPAAASSASVTVDVGVVLASNDGSAIDPALFPIRGKLQSMFRYSSYRMLDRFRRTLAVGETGDFVLPGGRSMRVTLVPAPTDKVRLAVQVMEGRKNLVTTTLGLSRGGMVLLAVPREEFSAPDRAREPKGMMILILSVD